MLSQVYRRASDALKRPKSSSVLPFAKGDGVVPGGDDDDGCRTSPQAKESGAPEESVLMPPELVPEDCERFVSAGSSGHSGSPTTQELHRLRDSYGLVEHELCKKNERIAQLEAELRQQRAAVQAATEAAQVAAEAAEALKKQLAEYKAKAESQTAEAAQERFRCQVCGRLELEASGHGAAGRMHRRNHFTKNEMVDPPEVPEEDNDRHREPRGHTSSGHLRMGGGKSRSQGRSNVNFKAFDNGDESSEDDDGYRNGLKKSRDRVPTGYVSARDLAEAEKEEMQSEAGSEAPKGRKARGPTQSCHVLIDFKRRTGRDHREESPGRDAVTLVPPPALRRGSTEGCLGKKDGPRRSVQVAEQPFGETASIGSVCSTSSTTPGSVSRRRVSFGGSAVKGPDVVAGEDDMSEPVHVEVVPIVPIADETKSPPPSPTVAPSPSPSTSTADRKEAFRRQRTRTSSNFVHAGAALQEDVAEVAAILKEEEQATKEAAEVAVKARQEPPPKAPAPPALTVALAPEVPAETPLPSPKAPVSPISPRLPSMGIKRRLDTFVNDKRLEAFGTETEANLGDQAPQNNLLMEATARDEHLSCLTRYWLWRRCAHRRGGGNSPHENREPREPAGVLTKGAGTTMTITEADVALLAEAAPLPLSALGMSPEHIAHCFRAFWVEAGDELWREDTPIDHVYVVGEGASIALSRGGRMLRDVGTGQSLGGEALQARCRWPHSATARRSGEVWAIDSSSFRELLALANEEGNFKEALSTLASGPAFKPVLPMQLTILAAHAEIIDLRKDECLFRHGEEGSTYFVLQQGALQVVKDGQTLRRYSDVGQSFGERALLDQVRHRRAATVIASEPSTVVALDLDLLSAVFAGSLEMFLHKSTVRQVFRGRDHGNQHFTEVPAETLEMWAEKCVVHFFDRGEDILQKAKEMEESGRGDLSGMLVLLAGDVFTQEPGGPALHTRSFEAIGMDHLKQRPSEWLQTLSAGEAGANIAALPLACHEEVFRHCGSLSDYIIYQRRLELVRKIFIFRHLSETQCDTLVTSMELVTMKKGQVVIQEGDMGSEFFIIVNGDVAVSKRHNFITKLSQPAYFGERALLYDEPRAATLTVASEQATFCVLTKQVFLEVLDGGILDFIAYRNKLLDTDLQFSDLEEQKIIGRGGYGTVKLVRHKQSGTRYALKCVTRERLSDQDRSLVQRERAILQLIDHPFCLKLVRSFKDSSCVYFLTELVTGGELLDALDRLDVLDRPQAQFYLASLLVVFEYIHEKNIVYRDLKPENVLLDQHGFIKLIDFGAARKLDSPSQKCYTLLGTPHFMATEMILGNGYGMSADVWAMGVCLYEFMVGRLPFDGDKPAAIFRQVVGKKPVWVPEDLDPPSADMLRWLLQKDPADRVQATSKGYRAMREHPFFQGFDFQGLINRTITPPCVPQGEQYSEDVTMTYTTSGAAREEDGVPARTRSRAQVMDDVDDWDADF